MLFFTKTNFYKRCFFQHLCHYLDRNFQTLNCSFSSNLLFSEKHPHTVAEPSRDLLESHSNLTFSCVFFFPSLTVSVLIQLPESHASVCLSTSFTFFTQCSSCPPNHMYQSSFLHGCQSRFLSVHVPSSVEILFPSSYVDISHSLPHGLGSVCSLPFCGAQLLCLPGASTGVKPL